MTNFYKKNIAIFVMFTLFIPNLVWGAEVDLNNYNYIISDAEALNYQSMDKKDIQEFLDSKGGYIANKSYMGNNPSPEQLALDPNKEYPKTRTTAEIIYNAAQEAKINPQFLITMLQKEMSLITDKAPTENQQKYAMGYDCPDRSGCAFKTSGFANQVRATAQQFAWDLGKDEETGKYRIYGYSWSPGKTSCADDYNSFLPCTSDGIEVTPENRITAAMYRYTPHVVGNMNFKRIWNKYGFGGEIDDEENDLPVAEPGFFPEGALLKSKGSQAGTIYLITGGEKRAFADMTSLLSRFDPDKVLLVDSAELDKYDNGYIIAYANYSVLESPDGDRYLIDGLTKRLIVSDEIFRQLGFNPDEIEKVSQSELDAYVTGDSLDASASPFAELWQDMSNEAIYLVKDGQKHRIVDQFIVDVNFPAMKIKDVTTKTLDDLKTSTPIKLVDGTLIKVETDARVYVISNGQRRLIPDGNTFGKLGYSWAGIYAVPSKIMNLHQLGEPILSRE
ncbi:MAG: hypothetical protein A2406_02340 [Candidatus Komeilibacteria bacterium RIFOXYC1_FULL_37_11]|uniref:Uncharacterized protein n=1 Tax=Candidatus Komeilibacteria bacterium RIFOXYC1_FULL_37_11 TaxID=1798555 RepID=A0A1G2BZQ2_9BACT|nr:MAG: hypothetical protein A2406_02340 [Candidatus Komeilibacteria bacterium RIFOXYC1_FULL_37_11]OGY95504.1 MAG: hypothetical protein A2611_02285 [Candidatus Komeilibacteria bacterium RIFOXYD1_FULL_37_29]